MEWSLYDNTGHRKYLTDAERRAFMRAAKSQPDEVYTFCLLLKETGCRISEALELTANHIDFAGGAIIFRSLKKRRDDVHRAVPASPFLLTELDRVHDVRQAQRMPGRGSDYRLWPWHRATAHRRITAIMKAARITGPHATAKGLRHGFGVAALGQGIPINILQRWLGHASLATTAIYGDAIGAEERKMARKLWDSDPSDRG